MTFRTPRGVAAVRGEPAGSHDASVRLARMRWWHLDRGVLAIENRVFAPDEWSPALFWSELAQRGTREYLVALAGEVGDPVVGYAGLATYGQPPHAEAFIQTIAVAPERQGHGVGALLLDTLLASADERHAQTVGLEVRTDNERAQRLYRARGFVAVGVRRGYYQPSGADALVMVRRRGGTR